MNPAAALLADIVLAKRADSEARQMDDLEWSRTRITLTRSLAGSCVQSEAMPGGSATVALCAILHDCQDSSDCHHLENKDVSRWQVGVG